VYELINNGSGTSQNPLKAIDKSRLWYPKKTASKIRELEEKREEF